MATKDGKIAKEGKWSAVNCERQGYETGADGYECGTVLKNDSNQVIKPAGRPVEWNKPDFDYVKDGSMVLQAQYVKTDEWKNSQGGYYNRLIGSDLDTADYFLYGYFEIRAKINLVEGAMSAFWLCGSRDDNVEYEIDIFECHGKYPGLFKQTALAHPYENGKGNGKSSATYNFAYQVQEIAGLSEKFKTDTLNAWWKKDALGPGYRNNGKDTLGTSSFFHVPDLTEWHTYGLDWREDSITWYIDGIPTMKLTIPEEGYQVDDKVKEAYKFNRPMRLILGLGVDCSNQDPWSLVPDGQYESVNNASMTIDYVRVYQDSKGKVYKYYGYEQ